MKEQRGTRSAVWQAGGMAALAIMVAACAGVGEQPQQVAVAESQLRERAKENLNLGLRQYERGEYGDATKNLTASLDHGLLSRSEQSSARKHLAFIFCVSGREAQCRDEFRKALESDPAFSLDAAEAGHPIWGPVYRNVRAQMSAAAPAADAAAKSPSGTAAPADRLLADGMAKYDAGDFGGAFKLLERALKEGIADKAQRIKAHKHAAFSLCLLRRNAACRNEFMKIFRIEPDFDLEPAEAKHPSWANIYAAAKQRARAAQSGAPAK